MHARLARTSLVAIAMVTIAPAVRAEPAAIDRLEVSERGSRFFTADSLDLDTAGEPYRFAAGVASTYARKLRTYGSDAEGQVTTLVENAFALHPGASVVVAPGARFALDMPVVFQTGAQTNLSRVAYFEPASPAIGDLRAAIDVRLFATPETVTALGVQIWLPTANADNYTGDGYARVGLHAGTAVNVDWLHAAARIGYVVRRELEPFGSVSLGSEARGVLAAGYRASNPSGTITEIVVGPELHAATIARDAFRHKATPVEALLGTHLGIGDARFGIGAGTAVVTGFGSAHFRGFLSIEWTPGATAARGRDRDGDGVPDVEDACPDVPGDVRGCPPPPRDRDAEGVVAPLQPDQPEPPPEPAPQAVPPAPERTQP